MKLVQVARLDRDSQVEDVAAEREAALLDLFPDGRVSDDRKLGHSVRRLGDVTASARNDRKADGLGHQTGGQRQ